MRRLGGDVRGSGQRLRCAPGGVEQAEQQLDGGGLAGAVGSEQAEHLAAADLEIDVSTARALGRPQKSLKTLVRPRTTTTGSPAGRAVWDWGHGCRGRHAGGRIKRVRGLSWGLALGGPAGRGAAGGFLGTG
jgi:hypothetical protein